MDFPQFVYIETTNKCNASCVMCPHEKMSRAQGVMPWRIFTRVIDQCRQLDTSQLTIFLHKEGEPLLDKQLIKRIRHTKKTLPDLRELGLNTNGMLLSETISAKLLDSGLGTIYVSLDGNSPDTYHRIRPQLDFETIVANLNRLITLKNGSTSKLKIVVQMLACQINQHEVDSFKNRWNDKADELYVKAMHSYLDGGNSSIADNFSSEQKSICFDPFNMIIVFWNGDCGICCWDYDNSVKTNNVMDATLLEIFNGDVFERVRKAHLEKRCDTLEPCNRCLRVFGGDQICDYETLSNSMENCHLTDEN